MTLTLSVFGITVVGSFSVNWSPLTSVCNFEIWDVKVIFFSGESVGFPASLLLFVLDKEPETVHEVEFDGKIHAFEFYKIPCVVTNCGICCRFDVPFGDVTVTSSIDF